jgi:hypothetical protein
MESYHFHAGRKSCCKKKATLYQDKVLVYAPTTSSQRLGSSALETEPPKPPFGEKHLMLTSCFTFHVPNITGSAQHLIIIKKLPLARAPVFLKAASQQTHQKYKFTLGF